MGGLPLCLVGVLGFVIYVVERRDFGLFVAVVVVLRNDFPPELTGGCMYEFQKSVRTLKINIAININRYKLFEFPAHRDNFNHNNLTRSLHFKIGAYTYRQVRLIDRILSGTDMHTFSGSDDDNCWCSNPSS